MKKLVAELRKIYPNAEYIESPDIILEDDEIRLNEHLSLQVVSSSEFGISNTKNGFDLTYVNKKDLIKTLKEKY